MKKLCSFVLTILTLFVLTAYTTAYSADRAGALSLTLGGGHDTFAARRHLQNTGVGFAAIGFDFTTHWGVEALIGAMNTHFKRHEHHFDERGNAVNLTLFSFDGVYRFTPCFPPYNNLEPYIMAGVGILGQNKSKTSARNQGNLNAGLGVAYFVDRNVAFRLEGRDFYTIVDGKNDIVVDAALTFLFDVC